MASVPMHDFISDNQERAGRLGNQHDTIRDAEGRALVLAPIDFGSKDMKILNASIVDGKWLSALQHTLSHSYPSRKHSYYTHTGLSPELTLSSITSLTTTSSDQKFNPPSPPHLGSGFDLVYQALNMTSTRSSASAQVQSLCRLVATGGYIQLEGTCAEDCGPAFRQMIGLAQDMIPGGSAEEDLVGDLEQLLREKGFADVGSASVRRMPGIKGTRDILKPESVKRIYEAANMLVPFFIVHPEKCNLELGELETLQHRLRMELEEQGAAYPLRIVWGQRPVKDP